MKNKNTPVLPASDDLYMSFRAALRQCCEDYGISFERSSVIRVIRDAAANTVSHMREVTPADVRQMRVYEQKIPNLIRCLMSMRIAWVRQMEDIGDCRLDDLYAVVSAEKLATVLTRSVQTYQH